jgi:hydroxypyruvate reductase
VPLPDAGPRAHARQIFAAGLQAADPGSCVRRALSLEGSHLRIGDSSFALGDVSRLLVVGAGKATPAMAAAVEEILGKSIQAGAINTKYGHGLPLRRIAIAECGHPVPDQAGLRGAERVLALLEGLDEDALVLGLFSGGGSALLPAPAEGISLEEKQETTRLLLSCGATIGQINALRKHLSRIKGGLLARAAAPARLVCLLLSDVIGDPLDTIASGPAYPDPTTFAHCLEIADHYGLRHRLPESVRLRLEQGAQGRLPETPKEGDPCFARVQNIVIGNNGLAVEAAAQQARTLGYNTLILSTRLQGEARQVAAMLASVALEVKAGDRPAKKPACLIAGGETTVTLRGPGKGGRNQELALAAALHLEGHQGIALLAAGTDGTDGPTDAAGAFADGATLARGRTKGLSARDFLERNDSYTYFHQLGDLLLTGPTGTNVMDLHIILIS